MSASTLTGFTKEERDQLLAEIATLERLPNQEGDQLIGLLRRYTEGLPRPTLSRCPITNAEVVHSIDTFGLDGLWWHYESALRPEESLPPTYLALTGAVHLAKDLEKATFLVVPGPEAPFVVPRMLVKEGVFAVVSHIKIGAHDGYPIFYFADPIPTGLRFNTWGRPMYHLDDNGDRLWNKAPEDEQELDFDLAPWIEQGKLLWIEPGDREAVLQKSVKGCPFIDLPGRRTFTWMQYGVV
ncbi:MAG TPA: hypothetical protein VG015_07705 [Candidatus Dormibacteraeota bacterium]|jgi:hypothetical protein|nr:hypothetical protein [Candidatus Dormibacteraeota bacterium]